MSDANRWWPIIASSGVLSLALLGDALIYAVLPVHAESFGISLVWVGILLSANRFVRVFAYGWIAQLTERFGLRRMCIIAAAGAVISTAMYGLAQGEALLLFARMLWGVSYAIFVLVTLTYAVEQRSSAGTRVGWSRSIQRVGPVIALLAGAWLTTVLGPRMVFVVLAGVTCLAIPLAWSLPRDAIKGAITKRQAALGRPKPVDCLFFFQGLGVDGVFALSITIILADRYDLSTAILSGGALLALRHLGEAVAAPLFGAIGDCFGAARVFALSGAITAVGFVLVATDFTVVGAVLMLVFRGALASLGPATIVQATGQHDSVMAPLARMQAWRDLGAAIGPLGTGFAISIVSPQFLHACVAVLLSLSITWWWCTRTKV
ncbi:MAG: DHA1 family inner membrane transport protein [Gammaproteobacteria bacterium]|jgi:DHA1 family inner membrane transport protein